MLREEGIAILEKTMLANAEYYQQRTFGTFSDCGTLMCGAGFCRMIEIGKKAFDAEVKKEGSGSTGFAAKCELSAVKLLDDGTLTEI